tara:strand:- start:15368 stop:17131 length:1764 start_codon:yes stop_codon:yes gene_type:complete
MTPEISTTIEHLRNRLKHQIGLFFKLSVIDEDDLTVEELIQQSIDVISNEWIESDPIEAEIRFNDIAIRTPNYTKSIWKVEGTGTVDQSSVLLLKIFFHEKVSDTQDYQMMADSIANNLAAKIDRILTREKVKENRELVEKAYSLGRIGTWEYDMINDELHWSDMTKEVHGFGPDYEPDVESTVMLFKEGFHRDTFAKAAEDAIQRFIPFDIELKIISGKGDERWIRATGEPEFENGECVRFYGFSQNVTNRKQAEEDLQISERRFKALIQDGSDMISIMDKEAVYKYVSPTKFKVLGISPEMMIGKSALDFIHENDVERTFSAFKELAYKEQVLLKPFRFKDVNGNWRWLEATVTNLTKDPAVRGYVANSRDITEKHLRLQQLEGSLKKKEVLLSEIHHRIKNNLSAITGLLQLQSMNENNREVVERLTDSVGRIHAMASMHEQLYQSQNFEKLDLTNRIKILVLNVRNTMQIDTDVEIDFHCEEIELRVNKALPISLIVNEVMTNIFKHAFKGLDKGKVSISLKRMMDKRIKLEIMDNGIGLPDNLEELKKDSLGLTLMDSLALQLSTEYSLTSSDKGTHFSIII